jgi:hypothetical protein
VAAALIALVVLAPSRSLLIDAGILQWRIHTTIKYWKFEKDSFHDSCVLLNWRRQKFVKKWNHISLKIHYLNKIVFISLNCLAEIVIITLTFYYPNITRMNVF